MNDKPRIKRNRGSTGGWTCETSGLTFEWGWGATPAAAYWNHAIRHMNVRCFELEKLTRSLSL